MADLAYKLRFWGVRGSVPTPSAANMRYGGNTSCIAVALGDHQHLIFDCGTGVRMLGESLPRSRDRGPASYHIFFTHYHFDHVEGLPFFLPLYDPQSTITFYGFDVEGRSVENILQSLIMPPYFPAPLSSVPAKASYVSLDGSRRVFGDVGVSCLELNHPNGSRSYRIERGDRRIVFATDHEHGDVEMDQALVRFSENADYLIYDATYVPTEYEMLRRGWGHSTWYEGIKIAREAKVKSLILFHHHPGHTDEQLEAILKLARQELPGVEIAREGMELPL